MQIRRVARTNTPAVGILSCCDEGSATIASSCGDRSIGATRSGGGCGAPTPCATPRRKHGGAPHSSGHADWSDADATHSRHFAGFAPSAVQCTPTAGGPGFRRGHKEEQSVLSLLTAAMCILLWIQLLFDIAAARTHSWSADYQLPAAPYKAHIADGRSQLPWGVL
eukprot:4390164-Amphidinium_carterae.1